MILRVLLEYFAFCEKSIEELLGENEPQFCNFVKELHKMFLEIPPLMIDEN